MLLKTLVPKTERLRGLDAPTREPSEPDEPEVPMKSVPVGVVGGFALLFVSFRDALEDGLAPCLGLDVAVDRVKGFAVGADTECV